MTDAHDDPACLPAGTRLGPFTILDRLAAGGMAVVYRARAPDGTLAAVKVLDADLLGERDRHRFARELAVLEALDHPNVVRVLDADVRATPPWIALELVDGPDLQTLIERWEVEPPPDRFARAERIARDLCAGLAHVHALGLVHRDVKPRNVLVGSEGAARLTDFGAVKGEDATLLTQVGQLVGTIAYMAPELISGDAVDARADLYGLGAVLYSLLTCRRPIEADTVAGFLARHLSETPQPPSSVDPTVPRRLERVCLRLLEKSPEQRYASATEVLAALDADEDASRPPLRGQEALLTAWRRRVASLRQGAGGAVGLVGPSGSGRSHLLAVFAESLAASAIPVVEDEDPAGPAVIVADDLDRDPVRQDALAARLWQRVALEGRPLLLLYAAERPLDLGVEGDVLEVTPLPRAAVVSLLRDRGMSGPAAAVLGPRLHAEHAGWPGPLLEQLDTLIQTGWLCRRDGVLGACRTLGELRGAPMPLPPRVQAALSRTLDALEPADRRVLDFIAVLGRPASAALLRKVGVEERRLDALVRSGLLGSTEGEEPGFGLAVPGAGPELRARLAPEARRALHGEVATALGAQGRRRSGSLEVARHLLAAGNEDEAWPVLLRAARQLARQGEHAEVLRVCREAREVRGAGTESADRWLAMLEGESLLALGRWPEAVGPLEEAVRLARGEDDPATLARCLGALGRAWYRQGAFGEARPPLEEALRVAPLDAPERAPASRALGDILLRAGELDRSEALWSQAVTLAERVGARDAQARAWRGIAHVRAFQGRWQDTRQALERADELLSAEGDPRVRIGVLLRTLELDLAGARYETARRRADVLRDLLEARELPDRLDEAWTLTAEVHLALGEGTAAVEAAAEARRLVIPRGPGDPVRLRLARLLLELSDPEAASALPDEAVLDDEPVDRPVLQQRALLARVLAPVAPARAAGIARRCLEAAPARVALTAAATWRDLSLALADVGETEEARTAAKRGIRALDGPGTEGATLGLLLALHAASPDPRVLSAAGQVARRVASWLSADAARGFTSRPEVAEALAANGPDPSAPR